MVEWRDNPFPRSLSIGMRIVLIFSLSFIVIVLLGGYIYTGIWVLPAFGISVVSIFIAYFFYSRYKFNRDIPHQVGTSGYGVHLRYFNGKERVIPWNEILYLKVFKASLDPEVGVLVGKDKFMIKNIGIWGDSIGIIQKEIESRFPRQKPLTDDTVWMDNSREKTEKLFFAEMSALFAVVFIIFAIWIYYGLLVPGTIGMGLFITLLLFFIVLLVFVNVIVFLVIRTQWHSRPQKVGIDRTGIHISSGDEVKEIKWEKIEKVRFFFGDGFRNYPLVGRIETRPYTKYSLLKFEIAHEIDRYKKSMEP
jgi:hypothetical protein